MFDRKAYMKEYNKKYRIIHGDLMNKCSAEFYKKNKKSILLEQRLNREKIRERERRNYHANIFKKRRSRTEYNKRLRVSGGLNKELIQMVYEDNIKRYGTLTCSYCQNTIKFGKDSIDHIFPLIRGGKSIYSNLCVACFSCNSSKGFKTIEEYKEFLSAH